ncbi:penicillin-binding protein 1C [Castellaniella sp.]|uniref:penicillin-binding protein 1C n=1 Tax=Castellaniella sp. TaxID=1955812 RepID=UPI002AFFBBD4|nr:penicillin-binding protein 1C [Castellaniella sp.]
MLGRRLGVWLLAAALWPLSASASAAADVAVSAAALPDYEAVRQAWRASDIRVLAADGREIQRVRTDFSARRGDWAPLQDISAALQRAVVQSEDHRFYAHGGVDWLASASAAWTAAWGDGRRGASTLSMQLAAMLDADLRRGPAGRGVWQKLDQMQAARQLESRWSKAQILEAYLNLADYRGELRGVDALSRVMFQKQASGLTLRESALAAVLLRGPNASVAVLTQRSCALLQDLGRPEGCEGLRDFIGLSLSRAHASRFEAPGLAPHWAHQLIRDGQVSADGTVRSTLDADLQALAVRSVRRHLMDLQGTGVTDAAVVVLDNRSGAVRAYVGSSGSLSEAAEVDHAQALRQAGSTLKPFLYALALDEQRLTAASLLDDRPLDLDGGSGLYIPDNYDHRFSGWVSARTALASSLNIPAVRVLLLMGTDVLAQRLTALGLPLTRDGDYYGYSLALGSADVTLLSLTNAYRALARGGDYAPVRMAAARPDAPDQAGSPVFSSGAAWIVGDILADRQARARTFGLDSPLSTQSWTAVKTGTSRDMRDNWTVGWSADDTVGVWVGNSAGASMRQVSGVSGAGPIWHDLMEWLTRRRAALHKDHASPSAPPRVVAGSLGRVAGLPAGQPARPDEVVPAPVRFAAGLEPARVEYFLGDTTQAVFAPPGQGATPGRPRIAAPVDGTVIALDPDIPWKRQRLPLRAVDALSRPVTDVRWFLNGQPYGAGGAPDWAPQPGRHVFQLRDAQGSVLDQAQVTVRAGSWAAPDR